MTMHRNLDRALLRYATGDMSASERQRFEAHLATCERCQKSLAEWRELASAVRDVAQRRAVSLPPLDFVRLENQPEGEKLMQPTAVLRPRTLPFVYSALVAVIALGFVAIFGAMLMRGDSDGSFAALAALTETPTEFTASSTMSLQHRDSTPMPELPAGTRMGLPLSDVPNGYGIVVVAVESIDNGSVIDLDSIVLYALPNRFVPDNAPGHIEQVEGRIARTNIHCGQIITDGMLATNAREVTPNMEAVGATLCSSNWGMNVEMRHSTVFIMTDPVETQDVVVFNQALPAGTIVDRSMLSVEAYPSALVPPIVFGHDAVLGSVLTGDVAPYTILVADMVAGKVPEGMTGITIPSGRYYAANDLRGVETVSIGGSFRLPSDVEPDAMNPGFGLDFIERLRVIAVGSFGVTVAGIPGMADRIQVMLDSQQQITIVRDATTDLEADGSRVEVGIPLSRIWGGSPLGVGQEVNVLSTLQFVDAAIVSDEATAEAEEPEHAMYVAVEGAMIVAVDDSQITLNIFAEDAELLNWYVDSGAPMWFELAS